jgi:hypothetical protein
MLAGEVERDHEEQRSGPPVDRVNVSGSRSPRRSQISQTANQIRVIVPQPVLGRMRLGWRFGRARPR